ncbi:hypothetical protein ABID16_000089 [Rhizobium aquaticum]|uniref:Uncharacterized protein n=1 Tax=Rhizobium aquaticum TaxID=1549636 RepID=A0ABV2IVQ7_9HYPH
MAGQSYGPIEIFRAGTFTPMNGEPAKITTRELKEIASTYDPVNYPAPVVIGHPKTDTPAYGWVDKLYVEGDKLMATTRETVAEFADMVKEGRYKKVSVSLFLPNSTANPKPGSVYLQHLGFLGGASPAVPGLKPVQFSHVAGGTFDLQQSVEFAGFSSGERREFEALRRERAAMRIERLIEDGRVLPVFRDEVVDFAASLDSSDTISFADGPKTTSRDWFLSYLERQPKVVSFGAVDVSGDPFAGKPQSIVIPNGYTIDPARHQLYQRAREIERAKNISFAEAVDLASEE